MGDNMVLEKIEEIETILAHPITCGLSPETEEGRAGLRKLEKQHEKLVRQIHNRQSYKMFKGFLDFLNTEPSKTEILKRLYALLDSRLSFGSATNSIWAEESLTLLLKERKT